jgi:hypothetical protein
MELKSISTIDIYHLPKSFKLNIASSDLALYQLFVGPSDILEKMLLM